MLMMFTDFQKIAIVKKPKSRNPKWSLWDSKKLLWCLRVLRKLRLVRKSHWSTKMMSTSRQKSATALKTMLSDVDDVYMSPKNCDSSENYAEWHKWCRHFSKKVRSFWKRKFRWFFQQKIWLKNVILKKSTIFNIFWKSHLST